MKIKRIFGLSKVPYHLHECFELINKYLSEDDIRAIKEMNEDDTYMLHFTLGMFLRNEWGLWHGSPLAKYFNSWGINHADDMSAIVLKSFWRYLHNKSLRISEQVEECKKYWENV